MTSQVVILDSALMDIASGKEFYEKVDFGLGDYFADCTFTEITALGFRFGLHKVEYGYHRMLTKTFPFAVYYEVSAEKSKRVVAVLDMRQNPKTRETILKSR